MIAPPLCPRPSSRLLPPLAGLSATLTLGIFGPAVPGVWQLLTLSAFMPLIGAVLSGYAGLIAYELAQRTTGSAQAPAVAALPASLIAASLPGIGVPALLGTLCLTSFVAWRSDRHQRLGFVGQCACALGLAAASLDSEVAGSLSAVAMLSVAIALTRRATLRPANDNSEIEQPGEIRWSPIEPAPAAELRTWQKTYGE